MIGSCMGSSGPASVDPATGRPYGMAFPVLTIRDMVRAQALLVDHLGIGTLAVVVIVLLLFKRKLDATDPKKK